MRRVVTRVRKRVWGVGVGGSGRDKKKIRFFSRGAIGAFTWGADI
jgi:hypothetical protein